MPLQPDACYRALRARDARFDGRFFVGVSTTRIYCRPVCPARSPRRENCNFFANAAAAEQAGFRPCLRCRPELAPGLATIDASRALAQTAASLIDDGLVNDGGLPALARRLGVTDRHLRRIFEVECGVTPVAYAQTARLLLAKRLLTDSALPLTEVALAAGFGSVRRFNSLFAERYRMSPGSLRRTAAPARPLAHHTFRLHTRAPFDFGALLQFFSARAIDGVEHVDTRSYRRTLRANGADGRPVVGWVEIRRAPRGGIETRIDARLVPAAARVLALAKHSFDLHCRPDQVVATLGLLAAPNPGLRVPGTFDGFELAVRAVLGQQITVKSATTLAARLAQRFGTPLADAPVGLTLLFPSAEAIAACAPRDIAALGIIAQRARALVQLARAVAAGTLPLHAGADVATTVAALREIDGIGPWTAQYIAMRALRWPDAFPSGDIAVMKALRASSPAAALAAAEAWRPWRSYAVMHLWQSNNGAKR